MTECQWPDTRTIGIICTSDASVRKTPGGGEERQVITGHLEAGATCLRDRDPSSPDDIDIPHDMSCSQRSTGHASKDRETLSISICESLPRHPADMFKSRLAVTNLKCVTASMDHGAYGPLLFERVS